MPNSETLRTKGIKPSFINEKINQRRRQGEFQQLNQVDDSRLFFRVTDIEGKTFSYEEDNGIMPVAAIDSNSFKVFELTDIGQLLQSQLVQQPQPNLPKAFQNQYLRMFNRELVKEEVQMVGRFIEINEGTKSYTNNSYPLFKIEKDAVVGGVRTPVVYKTIDPIYIEAKTEDPFEKPAQLIINFKMDVESEVTGGTLNGPQPLNNLKDLNLSSGSYINESFVVY